MVSSSVHISAGAWNLPRTEINGSNQTWRHKCYLFSEANGYSRKFFKKRQSFLLRFVPRCFPNVTYRSRSSAYNALFVHVQP